MKPTKLAPSFLVIPFALATLACPTRPIDKTQVPAGTGGGGHGAGGRRRRGRRRRSGIWCGWRRWCGRRARRWRRGIRRRHRGHGGFAGGCRRTGGTAGGTASAGGGTAGAAGGPVGAGGGEAGTAGARDGQPCSIAVDCASAVSAPASTSTWTETATAPVSPPASAGRFAPIGYASMNGDCCDNATNIAVAKLIHPGADFQTTSAGGVCGITWDYDCSGTVESNPQDLRQLFRSTRAANVSPATGQRPRVVPRG